MSFPHLLQFSPRDSNRLADREYLVVVCAGDARAIRAALPRPLEPDGSNTVRLRFIATRAAAGAGCHLETDVVIPALFDGAAVDYTAQRYADEELPAFAGDVGRLAAWPRRPGRTRLLFMRETAAAVLEISGRAVVLAEMGHGKHGSLGSEASACSAHAVRRLLAPTQVNLKRVPAAGGRAAVAQLVGIGIGDVRVKSAWAGAARMHRSSGLAPITDFPLRRVVAGFNFVADVTVGSGQVLFDYKREARRPISSVLAQLASGLAPRLQGAA
jgi:acetoacetate decarboxylase